MLSSYECKKVNTGLKSILRDYREKYDSACRTSREAYIKELPPGKPAPNEGRIYGEAPRQNFETECAKMREKVNETMIPALQEMKNYITKAPEPDAVAAISLLNMRKAVTKNEIDDLLDRYGSNVMAHRTICDIAASHDIHIMPDEHEEVYADMEGVKSSMDRTLTLKSAETGHMNNGYFGAIEMGIDRAFPVAE